MKFHTSLLCLLLPAAFADTPAPRPAAETGEVYAIACSAAVWEDSAWRGVIADLYAKHGNSGRFDAVRCAVLAESPENGDAKAIASFLRKSGARYAAIVMKPEEIGYKTVSTLHRAARMVDDDPWGDCMWGIITGATAQDARRIAAASEPLIIKRLLSTTNVHHASFEHSYCITDWTNAPVREQTGGNEPHTIEWPEDAGREQLFAEQLATQKPQLLVTSSHATQFNLEMPFGKGLIFPARGKFYPLTQGKMPGFAAPLRAAMKGDHRPMDNLAALSLVPAIEPDGEPRVWLAAGNCLIGNAQHSANSMVVTALSAYTCNQMVGYTVPSWYGKGGWGTLSLFMSNAQGTSLAEAWFLNNQFIIHETMALSPQLLAAEFNGEEMDSPFLQQMTLTIQQQQLPVEEAQNIIGLVHDRDVVAFYGDPAWHASIDNILSTRPLCIEWRGEKSFTITASGNHKGRAAIWYPRAATGAGATGCDAPDAVFTNDFILFPELELKEGETRTIHIH